MGGFRGWVVDFVDPDGLFPLTPALSLGEREPVSPRSTELERSGLTERARPPDALPAFPPLPGGEGRGEGEGTAEISDASTFSTRNRNRGEAKTGIIACATPSSNRLPDSR